MGCGGNGKVILDPSSVKLKHHEVFQRLNFSDIKPEQIEKYTEKNLYLHLKHTGYILMIEQTVFHLNQAMKGCFETKLDKEKIIVKLIYLFFSKHAQSKIIDAKKECLKQYFEINKHKMLYFWYSIEALPRILNYLLIQSLCPVLLPNEDNDLEYFFGGHVYEGIYGVNSPNYVGKKIQEIFPNSNHFKTEAIIKEFCYLEKDNEYVQNMIQLEKINEDLPIDERKILTVDEEFKLNLVAKFLLFFNPFVLYEIYIGNTYSLDFFNLGYNTLTKQIKEEVKKNENNAKLELSKKQFKEDQNEICDKNAKDSEKENISEVNINKPISQSEEKIFVNENQSKKFPESDNFENIKNTEKKLKKKSKASKVKVSKHNNNRMFDFLNDGVENQSSDES